MILQLQHLLNVFHLKNSGINSQMLSRSCKFLFIYAYICICNLLYLLQKIHEFYILSIKSFPLSYYSLSRFAVAPYNLVPYWLNAPPISAYASQLFPKAFPSVMLIVKSHVQCLRAPHLLLPEPCAVLRPRTNVCPVPSASCGLSSR